MDSLECLKACAGLKPADQCGKLYQIAEGCIDGACNISGLVNDLPAALREIEVKDISRHPAVKVVLGHLAFLCGEGMGSSFESLEVYDRWKGTLSHPTAEDGYTVDATSRIVVAGP